MNIRRQPTMPTQSPEFAAAWVPVSKVPRKDGSTGVFPHFVDRAKPGVIAVLANGRRFVNEALSYLQPLPKHPKRVTKYRKVHYEHTKVRPHTVA
jgi:FAD binding domain